MQFVATEIAGTRQLERSHPILLCISPIFRDMYVHGLSTIKAGKGSAIPSQRLWKIVGMSSTHPTLALSHHNDMGTASLDGDDS